MQNRELIIGFSLIRNGVKYDYPFIESLKSLGTVCDETFVAFGKSEDETETRLKEIKNLKVIQTVWDENKRYGGEILSEQTNIALNEVRRHYSSGWAIYLQGDEVLTDFNREQLLKDLAQAKEEGCDCVRFRYLHFWLSYEKIAIAKRWYPQEIRAIRIDSSIVSHGDAQSFTGFKKPFESEVIVYHYGHVRAAGAYEKKKTDFHRWWHSDQEIPAVLKRAEKKDPLEKTLAYLGPHPIAMDSRIPKRISSIGPDIAVIGAKLDPEFVARIDTKKVIQVTDDKKLPHDFPKKWVFKMRPSLLKKVFSSKETVPEKMESPQARPWSDSFKLTLLLSQKGIGVRRPTNL